MMDPLERLQARDEAKDLLLRYFRGLDREDFALVRRCFADDATIDYDGYYVGGPDGLMRWLATPEGIDGMAQTMHLAGNILLDVGQAEVHAECYAMAHHVAVDGHDWAGKFTTMWLRYIDRIERRGADWVIASRRVLIEWIRMDDAGMWDEVPTASRRDREDPLYKFRHAP